MRSDDLAIGTTECSSCKLQMEQGTTTPTVHPLKLLALSYGLMPEIREKLKAGDKKDGDHMNVKIRLFARAKEIAGSDWVTIDVPKTARVGDVRQALAIRFPGLSPLASSLLIALGNDYADDSIPISEEAELACFPPVSGGLTSNTMTLPTNRRWSFPPPCFHLNL